MQAQSHTFFAKRQRKHLFANINFWKKERNRNYIYKILNIYTDITYESRLIYRIYAINASACANHIHAVRERDICRARTTYMPCVNHIYPVREPHICRARTIYMPCANHLYPVQKPHKSGRNKPLRIPSEEDFRVFLEMYGFRYRTIYQQDTDFYFDISNRPRLRTEISHSKAYRKYKLTQWQLRLFCHIPKYPLHFFLYKAHISHINTPNRCVYKP